MYACRADDKMASEYSLEGGGDVVFGASAAEGLCIGFLRRMSGDGMRAGGVYYLSIGFSGWATRWVQARRTVKVI